eukprot:7299830-Pyramimonas_sp.AAC.1
MVPASHVAECFSVGHFAARERPSIRGRGEVMEDTSGATEELVLVMEQQVSSGSCEGARERIGMLFRRPPIRGAHEVAAAGGRHR